MTHLTKLFACSTLFTAIAIANTATAKTRTDVEPISAGPVAPAYCPPCVRYIDKERCGCDLGPKVETMLVVKDPCSCRSAEVPVCIPACCLGSAPCVDAKFGKLGQGRAFYTWQNGYEIKLVVNKFGEFTVIYLGA